MVRLLKKSIFSIGIVMSCILLDSFLAYAEPELTINVDTLTKIKNRDVPYRLERSIATPDKIMIKIKPGELFNGLGDDGCTVRELLDSLKKYGGEGAIAGFEYDVRFSVDDIQHTTFWIFFEEGISCDNGDLSVFDGYYDYRIYPDGGPKGELICYWTSLSGNDPGDEVIAKIKAVNDSLGLGALKNGWSFEDVNGVKCWTYYENNEKITGFRDIDEKKYYFKQDGSMAHSGYETIDGGLYHFDTEGTMDTKWKLINDALYYFDMSGKALEGYQVGIDGDPRPRFFWTDGYVLEDGTIPSKGTLARKTPYQVICKDGQIKYLADPDGYLYTDHIVNIDGTAYTIDKEGNVAKKTSLFETRIAELKNMFAEGSYWQNNGKNDPSHSIANVKGYTQDNQFDGAWQCNGFAKYLFHYVYSDEKEKTSQTSGVFATRQILYEQAKTNDVKKGDYVRLDGHSIFIADIYQGNDGAIYWDVALEAWGSQNSKIVHEVYKVINDKQVVGTLANKQIYSIDSIRSASNELRARVGL